MTSGETSGAEAARGLVTAFAEAMALPRGSQAQLAAARAFNRRFDAHAAAYPDDDVAALALRASRLGMAYEQAFADAVYIRSLGT